MTQTTAPRGQRKRGPKDIGTQRRKEIATEATRAWRYRAARDRVIKIVDGWPPLTSEQREQLALLLHPGTDAGSGAEPAS